jgi:hypothetical protein
MNRATRINVATCGVILAISGMLAHDLFEVLQGNKPTEGLFLLAFVAGFAYDIERQEAA